MPFLDSSNKDEHVKLSRRKPIALPQLTWSDAHSCNDYAVYGECDTVKCCSYYLWHGHVCRVSADLSLPPELTRPINGAISRDGFGEGWRGALCPPDMGPLSVALTQNIGQWWPLLLPTHCCTQTQGALNLWKELQVSVACQSVRYCALSVGEINESINRISTFQLTGQIWECFVLLILG